MRKPALLSYYCSLVWPFSFILIFLRRNIITMKWFVCNTMVTLKEFESFSLLWGCLLDKLLKLRLSMLGDNMSGEMLNEEAHHSEGQGWMRPHWYVWWNVEWRDTSLEGQGWLRPHWYIWWDVEWSDTSLCGTGLAEATLICLVRCGMKRHITLRNRVGWGHTDMSGEMWHEETHHSEGQGWMRPHWYVWWDVEWGDTPLWGIWLDEVRLICLVRCGMKRHFTLRDTARWGRTDMSGKLWNEETHHSEGHG